MAGTRGPVPKRSSERRRRNKESQPEIVKVDAPPVVIPDPEPSWHAIARDWYLSLRESGQAQFYEPSDWQYARYIAQAMSINLKQGKKFSSMLLAAVQSGMNDLLTTEAARRRARMEIERDTGESQQQPAGVVAIASYRKTLGG